MVERAAQALYERDAKQSSTRWNTWPFASVRKQEAYRDRVRAVFFAMREPSEEMMQAGMNVGSFPMCDGEVRVRWEAMIDEALK